MDTKETFINSIFCISMTKFDLQYAHRLYGFVQWVYTSWRGSGGVPPSSFLQKYKRFSPLGERLFGNMRGISYL